MLALILYMLGLIGINLNLSQTYVSFVILFHYMMLYMLPRYITGTLRIGNIVISVDVALAIQVRKCIEVESSLIFKSCCLVVES
jgi:hypothetical protein